MNRKQSNGQNANEEVEAMKQENLQQDSQQQKQKDITQNMIYHIIIDRKVIFSIVILSKFQQEQQQNRPQTDKIVQQSYKYFTLTQKNVNQWKSLLQFQKLLSFQDINKNHKQKQKIKSNNSSLCLNEIYIKHKLKQQKLSKLHKLPQFQDLLKYYYQSSRKNIEFNTNNIFNSTNHGIWKFINSNSITQLHLIVMPSDLMQKYSLIASYKFQKIGNKDLENLRFLEVAFGDVYYQARAGLEWLVYCNLPSIQVISLSNVTYIKSIKPFAKTNWRKLRNISIQSYNGQHYSQIFHNFVSHYLSRTVFDGEVYSKKPYRAFESDSNSTMFDNPGYYTHCKFYDLSFTYLEKFVKMQVQTKIPFLYISPHENGSSWRYMRINNMISPLSTLIQALKRRRHDQTINFNDQRTYLY